MVKKIIKILLVVILVGAFIGTIVYLIRKNKKAPVIYKTETAFIHSIVKKTIATGKVEPRKEIEIKPQQVSGIIDEIYIEPGQYAKSGDKIAKIKIVPQLEALNSAEMRFKRAEIDFENARLEYNRQRQIYEKGIIPIADFQKVELDFNNAKIELKAAENNLQLIKEGALKDAESAANTIVRSTISGMVLDVPVEKGFSVIQTNNFNAGTTIATVADMGEMIFKGRVDETEVGKLREGMPLILTIGALADVKFDAELEYISPKGIEENGTTQFEIKASVELKDEYFIRAGYSATAEIELDKRDSVLAIHESLLIFDENNVDSTYVEVETAPQTFERRPVKVGLSDGINIEVISGITKEDKIKGGIEQNKKDKKDKK